jgi:hypothetical protein
MVLAGNQHGVGTHVRFNIAVPTAVDIAAAVLGDRGFVGLSRRQRSCC